MAKSIIFDDGNATLALERRRRLEMSTEFFLVPSSTFSSETTTSSSVHLSKTVCVGCPVETEKLAGFFRNEVWVIPVLALSAITMVMIAGFEVFVLCKAWRTTPSRRHLFLGQMLLLGLFGCAGLGAVLTASPTQLTCAVVRFGMGVSYAVVFASLLVKCVFLISLNGGVYLPAPYQALLLMFAVLIQIAIGAQWLLTSSPTITNITIVDDQTPANTNTKHRMLVTADDITNHHPPTTTQIQLCRTPYVEMLLSLIYVTFLILFVTVLAVKSRGIRDNYREATYIGLSVGCSITNWLVWSMSGLVIADRHKDACLALGLLITAISVFLIMFMPKGRQLAAMGKEGVYVEDRDDTFSSLSRAASGYSPSFFHFKPIKYQAYGNSNKHQHTVTTQGGQGPGGVKCVFLISLNGGVYLPAPYQALLLMFAVLIQIAIGAQWLLTSSPTITNITIVDDQTPANTNHKHRMLVTADDITNHHPPTTTTTIQLCRTPYVEMLLSLIYVTFLILFVTVLAVKSRGIRDNYREATYIGLSVGCSITNWLVWSMSGLVIADRHKDACLALGLLITAISVFLIMFMPKGRQLAAMGKEGVYVEDRDDTFSSLSRAASGYSPSFFHFKPIKYQAYSNSNKHQHTVTTQGGQGPGGDGAGLYPPPPSYNRLYQYQCYPSPPGYYSSRYLPGGVFLRPDDGNVYTTLEPTLSSNPNVYFQRGNGVHPGMMY